MGKTLVNLAICYKFTKVISTNCLQYLKRLWAGLKFTKIFFAKCKFSLLFAKVFSRQNFLLYGKIIHNLVDIPSDCLTPLPSFLRNGYYNQLNTKVDSYKFSFYPSVIIKLWNTLPQHIINSPTYTNFCNPLDIHTITPVHYNHM